MTAYLVLRGHPLQAGEDGPAITLTAEDVADTERRRARHESVVSVAAGEKLTEREALQALLLPSANNLAIVLARWDAGSVGDFVGRMNAAARSMGMTDTHYTDPSGYDETTVSMAADQVRLVDRAMRLPVFASIVATPTATLPVAGTVHNTNTLLGRDGFVGVKTGNTDGAGGCFAFRALRAIDGEQTTITGVVLAQPGANQIEAGLSAAVALVDRITGHQAAPHPQGRPRAHHSEDGTSGDSRSCGNYARSSTSATRFGLRPVSTPSRHVEGNMRSKLGPLATLAVIAAVVAGCANGSTGAESTSTAAGSGSTAAREQAVKFAECMRNNGVSQFPDPDASGRLTIDQVANGTSLDTNSPAFKQAISACKKLQPPGFTGTTRTPAQQQAALKFAQCIRDHGVPDFPDPNVNAPLIDTNRIPSANRPGGMSILNVAMRTCRDLAASAGVTGSR